MSWWASSIQYALSSVLVYYRLELNAFLEWYSFVTQGTIFVIDCMLATLLVRINGLCSCLFIAEDALLAS